MLEHLHAPGLSHTVSSQILVHATQAMPASIQANWDDEEADKRHARHDERERERTRSSERAFLLRPRSWWHNADKADLEYEVGRSSLVDRKARRSKLPAVTVDPFGSRQPFAGRQADPFGVRDGLGRPLQDQVSTTGLTAGQAASAYRRVLCGNARGMVFSTHLTITWSMVGVRTDQGVHDGLRKIFAVLRDFNRRYVAQGRAPLAWVWTLERSAAKGLHSHVIVACDANRRGLLLRAVAQAVCDFTGLTAAEVSAQQVAVQSHLMSGPTKPAYAIAMTAPRSKRDGGQSLPREIRAQWALWRYIFKGVEPSPDDGKNWMFRALARAPQGLVQGQRWGYSTATLGDAAWDRFARSVGGDPESVTRFVDRLSAIEYPEKIDNHSPIWSV